MAIERTTVVAACNPAAVPITIPSTSPIAHPVRQCSVACAAVPQPAEAVPPCVACMESCIGPSFPEYPQGVSMGLHLRTRRRQGRCPEYPDRVVAAEQCSTVGADEPMDPP